jgi:hypothetical protein
MTIDGDHMRYEISVKKDQSIILVERYYTSDTYDLYKHTLRLDASH